MVPPKRATIGDIARLAGVSAGAVSFALNGRPGVSEATRARILAIAQELQWRPNMAARTLVGARTGVIGLAVNRPARTLGAEAFFADLISGIQSGLTRTRTAMHLRVAVSLEDELEIYREWHGSQQVDGVILIDPRDDDPRLPLLRDVGLPAVVIGSHPAPQDGPTAVWIDDDHTANTLFDYLVALGHRHIAYLAGPAAFEHTALRVAAFNRLQASGVRTETVYTDYLPASAVIGTRRLLSSRERPTAIVFDNDVLAVAGLRVVQEMRVEVPGAISLASFDDSVIAGLVHPSITCMTRDTFELGEVAATTLMEQLDSPGPLPSRTGPQPVLTVRESTSPPRG
ncbi:LacI family DNA-binding transcriptional regulator [Psychromicrobium xiongbiense]|uniref:LacI family DNA-binding transcriptional regulator n=1 Tax=Psychromicrobium xiongbiense TaxID=3051184 RepID=UPI0025524F45|nr:LacI family DNA-binding transcriptional regulator [Psychromicrobium sp. YIM S02556]